MHGEGEPIRKWSQEMGNLVRGLAGRSPVTPGWGWGSALMKRYPGERESGGGKHLECRCGGRVTLRDSEEVT